jgi:hypothetical protein
MEAKIHVLHPDLKRAVNKAYQSLSSSSATKQNINLSQFRKDLFVTADFIRTVELPQGIAMDDYVSDSFQRHV